MTFVQSLVRLRTRPLVGLMLVGWLLAHDTARAETGVEVELTIDATLPMKEAALRSALVLRLAPRMARYRLRVRKLDEGLVEVEIDARRRVLELPDPASPRAVRELAIAAADLAHAPSSPQGPVAPLPVPPPVVDPAPAIVARPAEPARVELAALAAVGAGSNLDAALGTGLLDLSIRARGPLRVTATIGFGGGPLNELGTASAARLFLPARAAVAWRFRRFPIELRLGAALEASFVRASSGLDQTSRTAVVAGPSAALYVYLPPTRRRMRAMVGGGTDVFVNRTAWTAGSTPLVATERALFWIAVGASFEVAR